VPYWKRWKKNKEEHLMLESVKSEEIEVKEEAAMGDVVKEHLMKSIVKLGAR
jgi:hypothetical protein